MSDIIIKELSPVGGAQIAPEGEGFALTVPAEGGGVDLSRIITTTQRFLTFDLDFREDHCGVANIECFEPGGVPGLEIRFGVMPLKARICIDLDWFDASQLFPGHTPGQLKVVVHGHRVHREKLESVSFIMAPCYHDVHMYIENIRLTDERPTEYPLPDVKLIDEFGQLKTRDWPGKIKSEAELIEKLHGALDGNAGSYPVDTWDEFGGDTTRHMAPGTGFFTRTKREGRWYLLDPEGNAFFSMGPDCTVIRSDCRVDGVEKFMDVLPDKNIPGNETMYEEGHFRSPNAERNCSLFSFEQWNLRRAFGDEWYDKFAGYMGNRIRSGGMNTLGNWSDHGLFGRAGLPYVTMLRDFPTTQAKIFRDFPDVYSPEYEASAMEAARDLEQYRDDRFMIGYFLRNEPSWAFVDNLIIADEVLHNPAQTHCRVALVSSLRDKYGDVAALNAAWGTDFDSFDALDKPIEKASDFGAEAKADMHAFSRTMMDRYVSVPSRACRAVDPDHMNLGMRWAWISDPDIVTGWQNFDVFSINCYAFDPTMALDNVEKNGVDLPVMIGEFHFGAVDVGLPSTGLKGVPNQLERGKAYRYYCERVAAHPYGVGCHYFQCFDQFALGRFDGENYNIGLFDITLQPYEEMFKKSRESARVIYSVNAGETAPTDEQAQTIPMIAF